MSRRKQSPFEDIVDIAATFPWWVGVALAIVVYSVLHYFAAMDIALSSKPGQIGVSVTKSMFRAFALVLQYVIPAALLGGAVISVLGRRKRNALHSRVSNSGERGALEDMSWQDFEQLVGEYFRRKGFVVEETGGGGADGGIDLVLSRGKDSYLVQCKQWKARQIGVEIVRELYGVIAAKGAAGGYVVTSGVFTDEAKRFADGREIELIGGDQLVELIGAQHEPKLAVQRKAESGEQSSSTAPAASKASVPLCPQCGSAMVLRTARKGANAGSQFWGCSTYPKCRGTRPK